MRSESRTFLDAFTEVRQKRAEVLPNIGFASQLQRLEPTRERVGLYRGEPGRASLAALTLDRHLRRAGRGAHPLELGAECGFLAAFEQCGRNPR